MSQAMDIRQPVPQLSSTVIRMRLVWVWRPWASLAKYGRWEATDSSTSHRGALALEPVRRGAITGFLALGKWPWVKRLSHWTILKTTQVALPCLKRVIGLAKVSVIGSALVLVTPCQAAVLRSHTQSGHSTKHAFCTVQRPVRQSSEMNLPKIGMPQRVGW